MAAIAEGRKAPDLALENAAGDRVSLKGFKGKVIHTAQYGEGEAWAGKRAVVIGTGNSGHDVAQDL